MSDDYYSWVAKKAGIDKPRVAGQLSPEVKKIADVIEAPAELLKREEGMIVEESTATTGIMRKINEFWKTKV
jgi:hypothetical protein